MSSRRDKFNSRITAVRGDVFQGWLMFRLVENTWKPHCCLSCKVVAGIGWFSIPVSVNLHVSSVFLLISSKSTGTTRCRLRSEWKCWRFGLHMLTLLTFNRWCWTRTRPTSVKMIGWTLSQLCQDSVESEWWKWGPVLGELNFCSTTIHFF